MNGDREGLTSGRWLTARKLMVWTDFFCATGTRENNPWFKRKKRHPNHPKIPKTFDFVGFIYEFLPVFGDVCS